jgi:hypothetical protein
MFRTVLTAAAVMSLFIGTAVGAAPCRDAKGKFIKCPPPKTAPAPKKCRDAKGHFAKCGTPGAKPA